MDASPARPAMGDDARVSGAALLDDLLREFEKLRRLAEAALEQLDEHEWRTSVAGGNPVAVTVKHLSGNMRSRWRDVLTTDGEKPDRDRDAEFELSPADTPAALLVAWREGWTLLVDALEQAGPGRLMARVTIRGESHTLLQAALRQVSHYAYHVGQIVQEVRARRGDAWRSLSIPKGGSRAFDAATRPYLGAEAAAAPGGSDSARGAGASASAGANAGANVGASAGARAAPAVARGDPAPGSSARRDDVTVHDASAVRDVDVQRLFVHLAWADERLLAALPDDGSLPLALREAAHVIGAEENWLARLEQRDPRAPIWPDLPLAGLADLAARTHAAWRAFLGRLRDDDLARAATYTNSERRQFTNTVSDILVHVALHGQYHRGRVNLLLRQAGREAAPTDFIAFARGAPAATEASSAAARSRRP